MTRWIIEQWKQIRGNLKYEVLRTSVTAVAGSGIIAATSAMLHKKFEGVDSQWFIFGAIFCCALLVFVLSLIRFGSKSGISSSNSPNRLQIESFSETIQLGGLWIVPTTAYRLSIELVEIPNENEIVIQVSSGSIQYSGANVTVIAKPLGGGRYTLPRASVADGNECVCYWTVSEATFHGFYVYLHHANTFAHQATLVVYTIQAYSPTPRP